MGFEMKEVRVVGSVSRHNSARDDAHDALWAEVRARIREVVDDPKFREITLLADGLDDD